MNVEYWIKNEGEWQQVEHEVYDAFDGEKEIRPSTWRLMLLHELLLPYRYM